MGVMGKASRKVLKAIGYLETAKVSKEDAELLETIRKNVELDEDATREQIELELDDLRFCDPTTQWDEKDRRIREGSGRPCLTEDRLGPFLMQVTNEQRKNKPGCQVNPVDSGSDVDTAEVIQGLIRHIEYSSNADTAYDTAFWWAAAVGRGFYRLCTDYTDSESFEQEILIKRVPNPHMVFVDPAAQEADFSDMKWGGFKAWMSVEDFKAQYPKAEMANKGLTEWRSIGDDAPNWMNKDGGACLVVEYFYKDQKPAKLYKFMTETGETVGWELPEGVEAIDSRDAMRTTVKWVKCTAVEILERGELPGEYIPIVAVLGKEMIVNGKRSWAGIIRSGKDPQKRHNYLLTSQVERIAFMPLASWVGAKGFMGKNKEIWANAHKQQMATLEYEITGDEDKPINAPRLITEEAPIRAVTEAMVGAEQGMKAVLGMYDANIGNRQGGESGVAIQRLQSQGETGNYHLQDNLGRAIRYEGRIILSWLPTYYDTPRIVRIIGEDGTQKQIKINGPIQEGDIADKEAIGKVFNITTGKYDVTVSTGPSYQTRRQEDQAFLLGMIQNPAMGQMIATKAPDLIAKTMDSPIARELAKRLTPPEFAEKPGGGAQIPPQVQQQLQQSGQMIEQLTQTVHKLQDEIDGQMAKAQAELAKAQLDSQTKLQIAQMDNEAKLLIAEAQIAGNGMIPELQAKVDELNRQQEELAELALYLHGAVGGAMPPEAAEPVEPAEAPEEVSPAIPAGAQPPNAGPEAGMEQV